MRPCGVINRDNVLVKSRKSSIAELPVWQFNQSTKITVKTSVAVLLKGFFQYCISCPSSVGKKCAGKSFWGAFCIVNSVAFCGDFFSGNSVTFLTSNWIATPRAETYFAMTSHWDFQHSLKFLLLINVRHYPNVSTNSSFTSFSDDSSWSIIRQQSTRTLSVQYTIHNFSNRRLHWRDVQREHSEGMPYGMQVHGWLSVLHIRQYHRSKLLWIFLYL